MKKKLFIVLVALLTTATINAQNDYKASIGGTIGTLYGASFKGFFLPVNNLALQADLGVNLFAAAGNGGSFSAFTFELNPNILYQDLIKSWSEGSLSWYAGGGVSLGLMEGLGRYSSNYVWGKFGVNAAGGVEWSFSGIPLSLAFDFRPGYGLRFDSDYNWSFFDFKIVAAARYRF